MKKFRITQRITTLGLSSALIIAFGCTKEETNALHTANSAYSDPIAIENIDHGVLHA
mgnify:CR=1